MKYLMLRRGRIILGCFAVSSLLFMIFPAIDISISRLFFQHGSFPSQHWLLVLMHESMGYFLGLSMAAVLGIFICNRFFGRNVCGVDGKKVLFLILVLTIGAGLIVNVVFKDSFGRARPRDIAEFGGTRHHTPPFFVSKECGKNCSFSSGEAAGGFFSLALAFALSRRRSALIAAAGVGVAVSVCRIASGAHFFSDTVVSFFVMLIVADVLRVYMALTGQARPVVPAPVPVPVAALDPTPAAVIQPYPGPSKSL
jgi:lipid A 4'-phosphatase